MRKERRARSIVRMGQVARIERKVAPRGHLTRVFNAREGIVALTRKCLCPVRLTVVAKGNGKLKPSTL